MPSEKKTTHYSLDSFIGKEVEINPMDSYSKRGIVLEVNDHGIVFEITHASPHTYYVVGEIYFTSHRKVAVLKLLK